MVGGDGSSPFAVALGGDVTGGEAVVVVAAAADGVDAAAVSVD